MAKLTAIKYPHDLSADHNNGCCTFIGNCDENVNVFKCKNKDYTLVIGENLYDDYPLELIKSYIAKKQGKTNFWESVKQVIDDYEADAPKSKIKYPVSLTDSNGGKYSHIFDCCTFLETIPSSTNDLLIPVHVFHCLKNEPGLFYTYDSPTCETVWFVCKEFLETPTDNSFVSALMKIWSKIDQPKKTPTKPPKKLSPMKIFFLRYILTLVVNS